MRIYCIIFWKKMCFKNKYTTFSNLSHFNAGLFWVHDALENKQFCRSYKNSDSIMVQTKYFNIKIKI